MAERATGNERRGAFEEEHTSVVHNKTEPQAFCYSQIPFSQPAFRCFSARFRLFVAAIQFDSLVAMAATACVMSSVLAASGSSVTSSTTTTRTSASYNALLSSRRASFKTGVAIPTAAFTSASRAEPKRSLTIVAVKATREPETTAKETVDDSQAALEDLVKNVQEAWEKTDDKVAITGLGVAGLVALWAASGLIGAVDKLPLIPDFFEIVGILFSGWFVYRYLLFKPDREELFKKVDDIKSKITGQ